MDAITVELESLQKKRNSTAPYSSPSVRSLRSGIVLKVKRDSSGFTARVKGRAVARGNFQFDSTDYLEFYAPVTCIKIVLLLITIVTAYGWAVHLVDSKGSFLHATLPSTDDIRIKLPNVEGFPDSGKK